MYKKSILLIIFIGLSIPLFGEAPASTESSIQSSAIINEIILNQAPSPATKPTQTLYYKHMLGVHGGLSGGIGLCYRNYMGENFALQGTFFPYYNSVNENTKNGFLITGFFAQWFLHDFSHKAISVEARFFVWSGCMGDWYVEPSSEDFALAGGGGIGLEFYAIKKIVFTIATGYYILHTKTSTKINEPTMPLDFEATIGYRF